jgi:ribosome-binding protein aMBF1 (putative translation factor)
MDQIRHDAFDRVAVSLFCDIIGSCGGSSRSIRRWIPRSARYDMTKIKDLHKTWIKDATYRKEYDALEEEFTVMAAIAKARRRAGLSQAELARRMKTTQSTVARLESGRGQPSTRTLLRFAKATGHRLKISFQPMKGKG